LFADNVMRHFGIDMAMLGSERLGTPEFELVDMLLPKFEPFGRAQAGFVGVPPQVPFVLMVESFRPGVELSPANGGDFVGATGLDLLHPLLECFRNAAFVQLFSGRDFAFD
jgi:hypothetical protein